MNNGIKNTIIFLLGAAAGSAASWYLLKTKYERLAEEEIVSVKEAFARRLDEIEGIGDEDEQLKTEDAHKFTEEEKTNYASIVATHYGITKEEKGSSGVVELGTAPYTISPDEYGEKEDYEQVSLTYYADGVLADDFDEIVDEVDCKVGEDSLSKFGEFEDDCVFVRNDILKIDYEILKDERNFADLISNGDE